MSTVTSAIEHIGLTPIANRLGFYPSAVQKWRDDGRLPKTELAGLTNYADVIAEMSDGKFTADQLIASTLESWKRNQKKRARR